MSTARSERAAAVIERRIALVTVATPFLVIISSIFFFWGHGVSLTDLVVCVAMYTLTMFGITLGFHRLFTHRSYKCSFPLKALLGICGCMAAQGPIYFWAACHRHHHQSSDREGDPHSPHLFGNGLTGTLYGWWHAHTGWMLSHEPENYRRLVPELILDRKLIFIDRYYFLWIFLGLLLPAIAAACVTSTWTGFVGGLLWGGFIRIFLVHHSTWSINSICHLFGSSPFHTKDESRNNVVCALLTFGEGWHNNHHAFPSSARHGLRWWQADLVFKVILALRFFGLAWDIVEPTPQQIERALRR